MLGTFLLLLDVLGEEGKERGREKEDLEREGGREERGRERGRKERGREGRREGEREEDWCVLGQTPAQRRQHNMTSYMYIGGKMK